MPRSATKSLAFPLAGVSRRGPYRQQTRPYSAPWAMNVRTVGPAESRMRGGSRPGLVKLSSTQLTGITSLIPVSYVDESGNRQYDLVYIAGGALGFIRAGVATTTSAEMEDEFGADITDDSLVTYEFAATVTDADLQAAVRFGKIYFADSTLKVYDPATGVVEDVLATAGTVPTGQTIIALYRDRLFLAGLTQAWYCSRLGDPGDWDYGAALEDVGGAIAGQLSDAGVVGDVVTAMIPVHDAALVMATENSLWVLRGDPADGQLQNVSDMVGIIDPDGWAMSPDGEVCFLSNDGIYLYNAGGSGAPVRFSEERLPDELREIDPTAVTISMAYDAEERGYHLFLTPSSGNATHWWIDPENRAFWPQRVPETMQPVDATTLEEGGLPYAVVAGQDGYVRYFSDQVTDDDGTALTSHILIGPVRMSANDVKDGLLAELHSVFDNVSNSGTVTYRVIMGKSASEAAEAAKTDLDTLIAGGTPANVKASGTLSGGRNRVKRPRTRGAWTVIWLSSTERWSFELVALVMRQLGRHR